MADGRKVWPGARAARGGDPRRGSGRGADAGRDWPGPRLLAPGDRARAARLALTVLRHVEPADRVLAPHLRKAPPRTVQNVLRLAVVEMAWRARRRMAW